MDPYLITLRVRARVEADNASVLKATTGAFENKHKLLVVGTRGSLNIYYGEDVNKYKPEDWMKVAALGLLYVEHFEDKDLHVFAAEVDMETGALSLPELMRTKMARRSLSGKPVEQPKAEQTSMPLRS